MTAPRPTGLTESMKMLAAAKVVENLIEARHLTEQEAEQAKRDLARHYSPRFDGYELAKELDRSAGWNCNLEMAEILDLMGSFCDEEIRKVEREWFWRERPEPPFPVGSRIKVKWGNEEIIGKIAEIYPYEVARYAIEREGSDDPGNPIVKWEDVQAA